DPNLIGARKQNTPFTTATLWTRYNFLSTSKLHGLGLGFGAQHSGDKVPTYDRSFKTPAYTLFDLAVYFTPRNSNIQLAVIAKNLTDKAFWVGAQNYLRLFPGAPRNFLATATYTF
ncbi:MAG: TonB-dependent receptor domain-containing protein, partial [Flavobacteriales bacterium]